MNELYVENIICFKTNAKTLDEAINDFLKKCADAGIDINIEDAEILYINRENRRDI